MSSHHERHGQVKERSGEPKPPALTLQNLVGLPKDATSQSGRLLFENESVAESIVEAKKQGIPMEMIACPYHDSRQGIPMHVSAMMAMQDDWRAIINGLGWIHHHYFQGRTPQRIKLKDAYELTMVGQRAVGFAMKRAVNPYSQYNEIPDDVASIYKVSRGIVGALAKLPQRPHNEVTPNGLYEFVNKNDYLIVDNEACAGPQRRIVQALEALFYGQHADPSQSTMATYFPDVQGLLKYTKAVGQTVIGATLITFELIDLKESIDEITSSDLDPKKKLKKFRDAANTYRRILLDHNTVSVKTHRDGNAALGRQIPTIPPTLEESSSLISGVISDAKLKYIEQVLLQDTRSS